MRVAIDGTAPVMGGGLTYLRELVPALCTSSAGDDFYLFLRSDISNLRFPLPSNCRPVSVLLPQTQRTMWRFAWQQLVLPFVLRSVEADVVLCPFGIAPFLAPCAVVLGIQNVSPYAGPSAATWVQRRRNQLLVWLTGLSTRKAECVFFVSDWSRRAISRRLGLLIEKTFVVHHGVSDRFRPPQLQSSHQNEALRPYVLVVGSVSSYKDYVTLLEAWKLVVPQFSGRFDLIIAGPIVEQTYYRKLDALMSHPGLRGRVFFRPDVPYEQVLGLYQKATVLVMPSHIETFGLPMLEAMSCGTPVLASDIPVAREVCADAAYYYQLGDPGDLGRKLLTLLNNANVRSDLARAGRERAGHFTWSKAAERTLQLLRTSSQRSLRGSMDAGVG